jgi:hypothetical protein
MEKVERKDYYGNVINKRVKKHRITFVDQAGKQLEEVFVVKSLFNGKNGK